MHLHINTYIFFYFDLKHLHPPWEFYEFYIKTYWNTLVKSLHYITLIRWIEIDQLFVPKPEFMIGNSKVTSFSHVLTWMMAGESCLAAQCMGVSPLRSLMLVRAWLSSNSSFTHAESLRSHARCSGVWPDASRALIWLEAERQRGWFNLWAETREAWKSDYVF